MCCRSTPASIRTLQLGLGMEHANVDTAKTITHVGLCAGYGGIELGLKRVLPTLRSVALCEIETFAIANLVAKMEAGLMDAAPVWTDLKTFPWAEFRDRVDILTGGYPCQPFSAAGKRAGKDDPRHLWPWIADGVAAMRPRVCFFENVEGHISLGLREVIADLESLGYQTTWGIFSASECLDASGRTAPHQRKRVFILANRHGERGQLPDWWREPAKQVPVGYGETWRDGSMANAASAGHSAHAGSICGSEGEARRQDVLEPQHCGATPWPTRPGEPQHAWEPARVVGNATDARCEGSRGQDDAGWQMQRPAEPDGSQSDWEMESRQRQTQPALGGDTDGIASGLDYAKLCVTCDNRTDELRLLGNGVVPATAALAFTTLLNEQRNTRHLA
jgi:DNA (cytosine-5)-methyltransferase 1